MFSEYNNITCQCFLCLILQNTTHLLIGSDILINIHYTHLHTLDLA